MHATLLSALLHRYLQLPISKKAFGGACILHGIVFIGLLISQIIPLFYGQPKPTPHVFTLVSGGSGGQANESNTQCGFELASKGASNQSLAAPLSGAIKSTATANPIPKSKLPLKKLSTLKTTTASKTISNQPKSVANKKVTQPINDLSTSKTAPAKASTAEPISFEAYQKQYRGKSKTAGTQQTSSEAGSSSIPTIDGKAFAQNFKNAIRASSTGMGTGSGIGDGTASGQTIVPIGFHEWAKAQWEIAWGTPKNFIVGTFAEVQFTFNNKGYITSFKILRSSKDAQFNKRIEAHISIFNERIGALNRINRGPKEVQSPQTYMFSIKDTI